ncbi:MAG: redoxin domain-containing protein [Gammaproteobacteria bacterium]|nr:redoxin domain-containing protein [Gammaproteobacteria bacterium]MCY4276486.1 redoxin domain-containing protein [Gammaproteobacteria bacterium]
MVQLEKWRERFESEGVNIAAMTYDSLEILKEFHEYRGLGFPLLRDVDGQHVNAFGVLNEDIGQGIPLPGMLWIAPDGQIQAKFAEPGYRTRPPLEDVFSRVSRTARSH